MTIRGAVAALLCRRLEINSLFFVFFLTILIHERSLGVKVQIPKKKLQLWNFFALTGRSRTKDWCCSQWTQESTTSAALHVPMCNVDLKKKEKKKKEEEC